MLGMYAGHPYGRPVREALLALLAKDPGHGYELKQALETEFGEAWPAINVGQIYKTLGRLEADHLVTSSPVVQSGRPDKRVFALTAAGHAALQHWLDTPVDAPRVKGEFFTKLAPATRGRLADPLALIDHQCRAHFVIFEISQSSPTGHGNGRHGWRWRERSCMFRPIWPGWSVARKPLEGSSHEHSGNDRSRTSLHVEGGSPYVRWMASTS